MFQNFNPLNFIQNLDILAVGMLSIFLVIGVVIIVTVLLNKIFKDKK
ncbi:MAG: oxaloacetate decarboxylase [Clostridia bacterium]|nr:oxaloacetate decarboxylase [Clostridia bacterium]